MQAEIVSIGTELLLGEIVDTNAAYIARQLRDINIDIYYKSTVGDNEGRITEVIDHALDRADIVITTGGLGPTVDDVTRQAIAAATGCELVFSEMLFKDIEDRFRSFGSTMTENNRQQAFIPDGAVPVHNPVGTAPCFIVEAERGIVMVMPGVPREMKYILHNELIPYLKEKFGLKGIIKARILHTAGIGESTLDDKIDDLMRLSNPTVGLAAHPGHTDIRIAAKADTEEEADALIAPIEADMRERVGEYIYGVDEDALEGVLGTLLQARGLKLALIEVGTEGRIGAKLADYGDVLAAHTVAEAPPDGDIRAYVEGEAASALESSGAAVSVAICTTDDETAIAINGPDFARSRHYGIGRSEGSSQDWGGYWGLSYAWRLLREMDGK